jgi:hypothetical protein
VAGVSLLALFRAKKEKPRVSVHGLPVVLPIATRGVVGLPLCAKGALRAVAGCGDCVKPAEQDRLVLPVLPTELRSFGAVGSSSLTARAPNSSSSSSSGSVGDGHSNGMPRTMCPAHPPCPRSPTLPYAM